MASANGNAVIGQSGGPTSVINQSLVGVVQEMRKAGLVQQLLGVSGIAEAHKLLAIANLSRTNGNFHRLLIEHDDFERRFGLARLRVLCFYSDRVESNRSVSLDPEDTPRILIESSHRL